MGWFSVAAFMRLVRSSMLDALDSEYVKLARIKGLPEWKVVWKHGLKNASIAPLTYFGLVVASMLTGSVVIETVFSWPGVGLLALQAVLARDYQVVQAVVIVAYEWFKLASGGKLPLAMPNKSAPAPKQQLLAFFEAIERELEKVEFFRPPDKRDTMQINLRNIFARMQPTRFWPSRRRKSARSPRTLLKALPQRSRNTNGGHG